jgi:glycosyltransferase involved in cell wall biosynthesis
MGLGLGDFDKDSVHNLSTPTKRMPNMGRFPGLGGGTPVLASNVTSVPEAAGEAAEYVDPTSVKEIRKKLEYMVKATEQDRSQWDDKMKHHLRSLNWRNSAEITAAALTGLPIEYFKENGR